jgi:hypothetical protein
MEAGSFTPWEQANLIDRQTKTNRQTDRQTNYVVDVWEQTKLIIFASSQNVKPTSFTNGGQVQPIGLRFGGVQNFGLGEYLQAQAGLPGAIQGPPKHKLHNTYALIATLLPATLTLRATRSMAALRLANCRGNRNSGSVATTNNKTKNNKNKHMAGDARSPCSGW